MALCKRHDGWLIRQVHAPKLTQKWLTSCQNVFWVSRSKTNISVSTDTITDIHFASNNLLVSVEIVELLIDKSNKHISNIYCTASF